MSYSAVTHTLGEDTGAVALVNSEVDGEFKSVFLMVVGKKIYVQRKERDGTTTWERELDFSSGQLRRSPNGRRGVRRG